MYERKLQETRARKEFSHFKSVASFYLILLIIIVIIIFFVDDVFGLSRLIFGVKGVIIKGMSYDLYKSAYGFKNDYLENFTIFNFGNFLRLHKPEFVKNVKVTYLFFDKLEVTFELKEKIAIIHERGRYYFVDREGKAWGSPTSLDLMRNIILFDVNDDFNVNNIEFLKKYANIISEIDYDRKLIYFKRGKVLSFVSWSDLIKNSQVVSYIYGILGPKKELFLVRNKIIIK